MAAGGTVSNRMCLCRLTERPKEISAHRAMAHSWSYIPWVANVEEVYIVTKGFQQPERDVYSNERTPAAREGCT